MRDLTNKLPQHDKTQVTNEEDDIISPSSKLSTLSLSFLHCPLSFLHCP